ncbi:hypothetical protein ABZ357_40250 [Streptomyces sp. NPDC005917]|uniref:hypothetical protein n=1 Tax=unclassified Streptomyces TaxID=2593676 RepID=UPI00340519E7
MAASTLHFTDATDAIDAGECMWSEDVIRLADEQEEYERQRAEAASKLRQAAPLRRTA